MKQIKIGLGFFFIFLLYGCSISTGFFIQNLTSSQQIITINYQKKISGDLDEKNEYLRFNYQEGIVKPGYFRKNRNNLKCLAKTVINDSSITVELPAHSTTRIDYTFNFNWIRTIRSVKILNQEYSVEDLNNKAEKKGANYIYKIQEP
ncbi:hypothetical protein FY557_09000 [Chryseobacterium sp. SN22]|uniref:hypothetical protein n=1 Tax=Chryseobacterium sp. SN22 TaxID=2606431 RepID=UPI0011EFE0CC|nr:hypothetical protein [Chryseobacterium sp. SN22]KAA0128392.1 hypothetical protein FY557_09000 [Chryseobacterium sp. SN22]